MHAKWEVQTPDLVHAYLQWKYGPLTEISPASHEVPSSAEPNISSDTPLRPTYHFEVTVVDIKGEHTDVPVRHMY